ncbi:hypothetical protein CEXT_791701 [Caerostris extrusa]|uniref:Uncharacterized protein n=1 Tax=Caerostris extrusa TaxID=172846 RepID=A0AAV4TPG6_CAEEX|nr:hypothetical protein CEXT_791701 [Caerostris extrusa]
MVFREKGGVCVSVCPPDRLLAVSTRAAVRTLSLRLLREQKGGEGAQIEMVLSRQGLSHGGKDCFFLCCDGRSSRRKCFLAYKLISPSPGDFGSSNLVGFSSKPSQFEIPSHYPLFRLLKF